MIGGVIKSALTAVLILLLGIAGLILSALSAPGVQASSTEKSDKIQNQNQKKDGHFIRRWLTLGPIIEGESAKKAIETDYLLLATGIPEWRFSTLKGAPKVGSMTTLALEGYEAQERIWKILKLPEASWDLNRMLLEEGEVDFALVYLLTFIKAEESTRRELLIGSNDGVRLWLNGRVAHTAAVERPLFVDQDRVAVDLKKGINCLMVKRLAAAIRRLLNGEIRFVAESLVEAENEEEKGKYKYEYEDHFPLKLGGSVRVLRISAIKGIFAEGNYSAVLTADDKKALVLIPLKEWEERLPKRHFVRIHRSTIINLEYLERLEKWFNHSYRLYLRQVKEPLTVSRRYVAKLKQKLK